MKSAKDVIADLLAKADIRINGDRPWDITVHDDRLYQRVLASRSLGLGESYMDGWWDCDQIDVAMDKIISAKIEEDIKPFSLIFHAIKAKLFNLQTRSRSKSVGEEHYDIGNKLYEKMLDPYMQYTCGYWKDAQTLNQAQEAKLDLICRKLKLEKGMTVLDIGCGWGGFAKYASEKYGVKVTGVTISKEQVKLASEKCKGLPVEILFQDYRDAAGKYDRVLSIGMFEHVGPKNYKEYFTKTNELLKDDGIALLHTIGFSETLPFGDPWFTKYIFPGGHLPSMLQISTAMEHNFKMEDWHNFGAYYDPTMMAWFENFDRSWPEIKDDYSERFYRMWKYYLLMTAGLWRSRKIQLWQIVMTKNGIRGGYVSPR